MTKKLSEAPLPEDNDWYLTQEEIQNSTKNNVFEWLQLVTTTVGTMDCNGKPVKIEVSHDDRPNGMPKWIFSYNVKVDGDIETRRYTRGDKRDQLEWTWVVYGRESAVIQDNNLYLRDANNLRHKYEIEYHTRHEGQRNEIERKEYRLIQVATMKYLPSQKMNVIQVPKYDTEIFEYKNPPKFEGGKLIDSPTKKRILINGTYPKEWDLPVSEGVEYNYSTLRTDSWYELRIQDTKRVMHKYLMTGAREVVFQEVEIRD